MDFIFTELLSFLTGLLFGGGVTWMAQKRIERKYKDWQVKLMYRGNVLVTRSISGRKVAQIVEEPSDLAVYVKGVISPYGRLQCDPLETPRLIRISHTAAHIIIDLDQDKDFELNQGFVL